MLDISNIRLVDNKTLSNRLEIVEDIVGHEQLFEPIEEELVRRMNNAIHKRDAAYAALREAQKEESELNDAFDRAECISAMRQMVDDEYGEPDTYMSLIIECANQCDGPVESCHSLRGKFKNLGVRSDLDADAGADA